MTANGEKNSEAGKTAASTSGTSSAENESNVMAGEIEEENERPNKSDNETIIYELKAEEELRFEVENKNKVSLVMRSGLAEIFGTEITKNKKYIFSDGAKIAVFTWHGCTIELIGKTEVAYVAQETPMTFYANIHGYLEELRQKADADNTKGPTVMLVGPTDVGKSTVCRILLNYAVRLGRRPIFVDIDVGQGQIAIPGTIGAILVERHADAEEGFSQQAPLVYHYGHNNPGANLSLYKTMIAELAAQVNHRASCNRKSLASGVFINTCGWVKDQGYKALLHAASAFEVDLILALDQERLYNKLKRDLPSFVKIVLTPKSGGVVERSKLQRADARDARVREYFYGLRTTYYPHSLDVKFSDFRLYKIGAPPLPDSCMPLGMKVDDNRTKVIPVQISPHLINHILSLSYATKVDEVLSSNLIGFVCVTNVNMEQQLVNILSPRPKPLPPGIFLLNDTQFIDIH